MSIYNRSTVYDYVGSDLFREFVGSKNIKYHQTYPLTSAFVGF